MGQKIKPRVYRWLFTVKKISRRNDEVTDDWSPKCRISFWKLWSFLWDAPVWKVRASKLVPNFTKNSPWDCESTPQWHSYFRYFQTLYAFPVIRIPTRLTPLAAPCDRIVWIFFPFLEQWMKTPKATHKWSCYLAPTCCCDYSKRLKYSKRYLKCTRKSNHRVQWWFLTVENNLEAKRWTLVFIQTKICS
jgi:hypothetical protein